VGERVLVLPTLYHLMWKHVPWAVGSPMVLDRAVARLARDPGSEAPDCAAGGVAMSPKLPGPQQVCCN
jgi:hypothetical protein